MRDLDVTVGPRRSSPSSHRRCSALFEAARWYCGRRSMRSAEQVIGAALPAGGRGPFVPGARARSCGTLMALPPALAAEVAELQRRHRAAARRPRPGDARRRAPRAAFADHRPAWPFGRLPVRRRADRGARRGRRSRAATTSRSSATCTRATTRSCRAVRASPPATRAVLRADSPRRPAPRQPTCCRPGVRAAASTRAACRSPRRRRSYIASDARRPARRTAAGPGWRTSSRSTAGTSSTAPASCACRCSTCSACRSSSAGVRTFELLPEDGAHAARRRRADRVAARELERPGG